MSAFDLIGSGASASQGSDALQGHEVSQGCEASQGSAIVAMSPASVLSRQFDLVALDLDGTLLTSDKRVTPRAALAIAEASRQGVRVVLASARPPRSVARLYAHLGLDTLQINYNGALIHDAPRRRHVHHLPIPADLARRVVRCARRADAKVVVSIEILDKWYTDHVDDSFPTETSRAFSPDFVGPLEAFLHKPATKLMLAGPPQRLGKVRAALAHKFADRLAMIVCDPYLIQIAHCDVDKAHALSRVAEHYGVAQDRVLAMGDAPNDEGMLRWAGVGVAVENAWQQVRRAADAIVPSNDNDGVAHALEHFLLDNRDDLTGP